MQNGNFVQYHHDRKIYYSKIPEVLHHLYSLQIQSSCDAQKTVATHRQRCLRVLDKTFKSTCWRTFADPGVLGHFGVHRSSCRRAGLRLIARPPRRVQNHGADTASDPVSMWTECRQRSSTNTSQSPASPASSSQHPVSITPSLPCLHWARMAAHLRQKRGIEIMSIYLWLCTGNCK